MTVLPRVRERDLDESGWKPASARWPLPHPWHDLDLLDFVSLTRIREPTYPADERR